MVQQKFALVFCAVKDFMKWLLFESFLHKKIPDGLFVLRTHWNAKDCIIKARRCTWLKLVPIPNTLRYVCNDFFDVCEKSHSDVLFFSVMAKLLQFCSYRIKTDCVSVGCWCCPKVVDVEVYLPPFLTKITKEDSIFRIKIVQIMIFLFH